MLRIEGKYRVIIDMQLISLKHGHTRDSNDSSDVFHYGSYCVSAALKKETSKEA